MQQYLNTLSAEYRYHAQLDVLSYLANVYQQSGEIIEAFYVYIQQDRSFLSVVDV